MRELNTLLEANSNILFIAPTGWGKTTLLLDIIKNSSHSWVYLAPLRALANEFYLRTYKIKNSFLIKSSKELKEFNENGLKFKLLIITPELLNFGTIQSLPSNTSFVFDEIHLFSYWGESFRPRLRECYEEVAGMEFPILSLTATMDENLLAKWKEEAYLTHERQFIINLKNHSLKKDPLQRIAISKNLKKDLLVEMEFKKVEHAKLIFCRYRQEVTKLEEELKGKGFNVLSCVGGQTNEFQAQLQANPSPDFILATSALSHGVNLPRISSVYLSYKVENFDFWIQMIGRAGRRDEEFVVFTHDYSFLSTRELFISFCYLLFIKIKNMIYPYELRRYFNSQNSLQG